MVDQNASDDDSQDTNGVEDSDAAEARIQAKLAQTMGDQPTAEELADQSEVAAAASSGPREVSAATIGRMMGLATTTELKLLEGKIDLMSTRVNNLMVRTEKVLNLLNAAPTGSDMERLDVQLATIRSLLQDGENVRAAVASSGAKSNLSASIQTNTPPPPAEDTAAGNDEGGDGEDSGEADDAAEDG